METLRVIRAEHAGACYGVQRALDLTYAAARDCDSVCTLGPLIHNPRVVDELADQGIGVAESVETIKADSVVIRSHGVVPQIIDTLSAKQLKIIDATCPHVLRAQRAAAQLAREGRHVIVVGEAGHPEVEGISEHARRAGGMCTIVATLHDIPARLPDALGVVVQTTQSREKFEMILHELHQRVSDIKVKDTICFATTQRQASAIDLAQQVDAMVIIGGRNSSNTTRLFEICAQHCPRTYHIESAHEIDPEWFENCATVGVSAGASTPDDQIESVVTYLESLRLSADPS